MWGLARRLGAGRVLLGEIVATPAEMLLNARLLRVPDGRVLAEQGAARQRGESELHLLDRVLAAVLAGAVGERAERLGALSDSLSAVLAYLAGVQAVRLGEHATANRRFTEALDIDPTFAVAALRRAQDVGSLLDAELVRTARDEAWALRSRLSPRDCALLTGALGPRYPKPSTGVEYLPALEEAVRLAPDDAETWRQLGWMTLEVGYARGGGDWVRRAAAAFDSAVALDPTNGAILESALIFAVEVSDTARVRNLEQTLLASGLTGEVADGARWLSAAVLGDTASLSAMRARFDEIDPQSIHTIVNGSITYDLPLENLMDLLQQRAARQRGSLSGYRLELAMLQGRVGMALTLADSLRATRAVLQQAITDPGYEEAGVAAGNRLRVVADTAHTPDPLCWSTIWRVFRGDTLDARAAIARIRELVGDRDNLPGPRVSRFDMCPRLLEAMLEQAGPHPSSYAALDWIDSLTSQGIGGWNALPINIAGLFIAQWRERQGDYEAARAALRRRPMIWNSPHMVVFPASLREEGRLAALVGDTAGAVRAYSHYLDLRTHPDPGPMAEEVKRVKEHLARLIAQHREAPRR